jgi:hypothetical protein
VLESDRSSNAISLNQIYFVPDPALPALTSAAIQLADRGCGVIVIYESAPLPLPVPK